MGTFFIGWNHYQEINHTENYYSGRILSKNCSLWAANTISTLKKPFFSERRISDRQVSNERRAEQRRERKKEKTSGAAFVTALITQLHRSNDTTSRNIFYNNQLAIILQYSVSSLLIVPRDLPTWNIQRGLSLQTERKVD